MRELEEIDNENETESKPNPFPFVELMTYDPNPFYKSKKMKRMLELFEISKEYKQAYPVRIDNWRDSVAAVKHIMWSFKVPITEAKTFLESLKCL